MEVQVGHTREAADYRAGHVRFVICVPVLTSTTVSEKDCFLRRADRMRPNSFGELVERVPSA